MNNLPPKLRRELAKDPEYKVCARRGLHGHECAGRITFEHALIYAGKQIQSRWAIIPLCEKAHNCGRWQDCGDMNKNINQWIALHRATDAEIAAISKAKDYRRYRDFLDLHFGPYPQKVIHTVEKPKINYPWLKERAEAV